MTNTKATAAHLASKGRYGDSTLVHMSPIEVWALERMSPNGKLTRNPDTGMPEAFGLTDILPAVAGIGASFLTGGALIPALAAGLTSYGTTGDLGKGLMSGLLSYGVGSALNVAAEPTSAAAVEASSQAASQAAATPGATAGSEAATQGLMNAGQVGSVGYQAPAASLATSAPSAAAPAALNPIQTAQSAFSNLQADPSGTLSKVFIDNAKSTTLPIAGSVLGSMALEPPTPFTPVGGTEPTRAELERRYPEQFPTNRDVVFPGSDYVPGTSGEFDYFPRMAAGGEARSLMGSKDALYAKGGIADQDGAAASKANIEAEAKMALIDHHPKAAEALARYERAFGREALDRLKGTVGVAGGRIRGAGGGLDDLIPGTIEGRKDVRLADGEFVVPADVVSMLGDGSSDHGVRKLHEMMDRIRVNKTGTKKQAKSIKDHKVMPA
jgi:hypothetical protein